jgi:RNA polymerase sigma factor (sigma-70 family)
LEPIGIGSRHKTMKIFMATNSDPLTGLRLSPHGSVAEPDTLSGTAVAEANLSVEVVFNQHWKSLVRFATLLVGNAAVGEELAQEAFARWYVHRASVEHPSAYLRSSVVNLVRGQHRRYKVLRRRSHLFEVDEDRNTGSPHDVMLDQIDALPERQRAAVILRFYEDRSEAEIAEIIGCRPGTVKSLLSRALATLRLGIER